jgi:hypothetical protein
MTLRNTYETHGPTKLRANKEVAVAAAIAKIDVISCALQGNSVTGLPDMKRIQASSDYGYAELSRNGDPTRYHFSTKYHDVALRVLDTRNFIINFNGCQNGYEVRRDYVLPESAQAEPLFVITPVLPDKELSTILAHSVVEGRRVDHQLETFTADDLSSDPAAEPHIRPFISAIDVVYGFVHSQLRD